MLPALANDTPVPERPLFWRQKTSEKATGALRTADRKLILSRSAEGNSVQLYDPAADPGEANNLAAAEPERTAALLAQWEAWSGRMRDPAYAPLGSDKTKKP